MGASSPITGPHRTHRVHRAAAGSIGGFLVLFGVLGAGRSTEFTSASGPVVMGLFTNGLLSTLSVAMGAVLVGAALRSGPVASTVSVTAGSLFLLSGVLHVLILDTSMNVLAFRMTNVIFSLVVGTFLLVLGAYGRFTGSLPADSPYARAGVAGPFVSHTPADAALGREMADAERAVALHRATAEQSTRVRAASLHRAHEQRLAAFAGSAGRRGLTDR